MARLRLNDVSSVGLTNPVTLTAGGATATWLTPPPFPTIAAPDYLVFMADPDSVRAEIIQVTAYTPGALTATVVRNFEPTSYGANAAIAHTAVPWVHGPTGVDLAAIDTETARALAAEATLRATVNALGAVAWQANTPYVAETIVTYNQILWQAPTGGVPARAVFSASDWTELASIAPVTSVAGRTGAVTLASTDVSGLGTAATQNKVAAGSAGVLDATDPSTSNARTPTDGSVTGGPAGPGVKIAANTITDANLSAANKAAAFDAAGAATAALASALNLAAAPTGVDDTAAVNAALAAGLPLRPGTYRCLGQIVNPNDGASPPKSTNPGAHLWGMGSYADGVWTGGPAGATILDLRYAGRTDAGCGTTSGSAVVTDANCLAADYGLFALGPGIPDRSTVLAVTPGASFVVGNGQTGTVLTAQIANGAVGVTSLAVSALQVAVASGDTILLGLGSTYQVLTASGPAAVGATAIPVNAFTATATYPVNTSVVDLAPGAATATASVSVTISGPKIDTRGRGVIEINGITLISGGTDNVPFLRTTNTTPKIHDCAIFGNAANSGTACQQDFAFLGGNLPVSIVDGSPNAAFQGYGGYVRDNYFAHIRRAVVGQVDCNAARVENNTFSTTCGTNLADGAPIEFYGVGTSYCTGNYVGLNTVEMVNYVYGTKLVYSTVNDIDKNGLFDAGGGVLAGVRCGVGATFNRIVVGWSADTYPAISEDAATAAGRNTVLVAHQNVESFYAQPQRFHERVTFDGAAGHGPTFAGGPGANVVQPAAATGSEGSVLWSILRSAAEPTNPGTVVFRVFQNGSVYVGGANAGLVFQDGTGAVTGSFGVGGLTRSGAGGPVNIDSGSGGSWITLKGYGVTLLDYLGVNQATVKVVSGAPTHAAPPGSLALNVLGGAGTTLYVKESGTGTTGWVAK